MWEWERDEIEAFAGSFGSVPLTLAPISPHRPFPPLLLVLSFDSIQGEYNTRHGVDAGGRWCADQGFNRGRDFVEFCTISWNRLDVGP